MPTRYVGRLSVRAGKSGRSTRNYPQRGGTEDGQTTMENKRKHLEFLQGAINRMASNLFLLKGWTITLIAALFALSAKDSNRAYALIAYFPTLVFWILDGYFLSQERRFRALYDRVRKLNESEIDFSMDTSPFKHELRNTWGGAMLSRTLLTYYGALALIMLALLLFIR
jgi:hypothetical protein